MNTNKSLLSFLKICFFALLLPFLSNCGSSSDDTNTDPEPSTAVETEVAIRSANQNISQIIRNTASATTGVGADSEALESLLAPLGITLAVNDEDGGISDNLINVMQSVLDEESSAINRIGDVISIQPDGTLICDEFSLLLGFSKEDETYSTCLNVVTDILVKITAENEQNGDIAVYYDGSQMLNVAYSENKLVISANLATASQTLQQLMQAIDPSVELALPETISGGIAMTLNNLGDQHGSMQLDISNMVKIIDNDAGYNINLEPVTLLSVTANGLTGTAMVSSKINTLSGEFPVEIDDDGNTVEAKLLMNSSEMVASVTDAGETLELNMDIAPMKLTFDSVEALSLAISAPQVSMTETMSLITMASAMELTLIVADDYDLVGGTTGAVTITSLVNTELKDQGESIYQVETGAIEILGTGGFSDFTSLIESDSCIGLDGLVTCPELEAME